MSCFEIHRLLRQVIKSVERYTSRYQRFIYITLIYFYTGSTPTSYRHIYDFFNMSSPEPYTIHVPDANIVKLKRKLEDTDYPDELESDDQWCYGAPLSDVKRLAEYWRTGFDWRKTEAGINELPNYRKKVNVDGFGDIDVHFVRQKSGVEGAIPLLFCHGCAFTPT